MRLCGAPTCVHGAEPCPRAAGHDGAHLWWVPWQDGRGTWRVVVYAGDLSDGDERRRVARGVFREYPSAGDVAELLGLLGPMRRLELARRTPVSEPDNAHRPIPVARLRIRELPRGMVLVG